MNENEVLWDRLAGTLKAYVENYLIKKSGGGKFGILPSYEVDYEISDRIIESLSKTLETGDIQNIWYIKIAGCKNINELPLYLQRLILQFLPRFFKEYPQYKDSECLAQNNTTSQ